MHGQLDAYLSACQLGITLASLGLGWVGEPAFAHLLEPLLARAGVDSPELVHGIAFFSAFFIISYLHIVIGELAPKSWAIRQPERLSLWTAVPLYAFYRTMYPAIWLLNASANAILRIAGQGEPGPHHEHHYSREELKLILHSSRGRDPSDQDMRVLASAVELGELEVVDWANFREDLVCLHADDSLEAILEMFRRHKQSRYPVLDAEQRVRRPAAHQGPAAGPARRWLTSCRGLRPGPDPPAGARIQAHAAEQLAGTVPPGRLALCPGRGGRWQGGRLPDHGGRAGGAGGDIQDEHRKTERGSRLPAGQAAGARRHAAVQDRAPARSTSTTSRPTPLLGWSTTASSACRRRTRSSRSTACASSSRRNEGGPKIVIAKVLRQG